MDQDEYKHSDLTDACLLLMSDISLYVMTAKSKACAHWDSLSLHATNRENKEGCLIRDPPPQRNIWPNNNVSLKGDKSLSYSWLVSSKI